MLRMLRVGKNAIFGNDVKGKLFLLCSISHPHVDIDEIRDAVYRRDFPYYSEKSYLPKKKEDLMYRNYYEHPGHKPMPNNTKSASHLMNYRHYKNTYLSEGMKNMGTELTNFVSGVASDSEKYKRNGFGRRKLY